ncbi:zinc finger and BTB domain-containing protein 24-like [Homarus americanus]|uniref:Zinc finger and BTB domain-containing protein 24-like 4 n=1 Tax=Homarus americanus TaxID=6706 RepID=A0A8J5N1I1_HOMAM|nr:zinc finger and BTB domain-containing protein 24-like [Homarus americanus]KAG7171487.1 Zinc finger and BTB domain-containing protein 24-like 4 [Homarus americanus]
MEEEQGTIVIQVTNAEWEQAAISDFEHLQVENLATIECGTVPEVSTISEVVAEDAPTTEQNPLNVVKVELIEKDNSKDLVLDTVSAPVVKHECQYCFAKFKSKSSYNAHIRAHYEERPFVCEICGSTFKTKACTDRHVRQHYQKKEYFCGTCGAEFASKYSCTKHTKNAHGAQASEVNMFRLKEEVSDQGENVLFIKVIKNGEAYRRRFRFIKSD